MKLHRHLVEQLISAVFEIFSQGKQADKVLERYLKAQRKWGARDRRFFAESAYEMVRHWRRLWVCAGMKDEKALDFAKLRLDQVWWVWARFEYEKSGELPDWPEVSDFIPADIDPTTLSRAVYESIPDWLDQRGAKDFGEFWDQRLSALNKPADVFLRANTLKSTRDNVIVRLQEESVEAWPVPDLPSAIKLPVRKNVFLTKAFKEGLFEVQDAASQTVASLLAPEPGMRVVDACAGAGGKSLHIAALMKNKGRLLSMDIHEWKLQELKLRARRAGVDIIETRVIESSKTIKRLESSADRVLLDVPCSGLGVLRRNPDKKWKIQPEDIDRLCGLQAEILNSYASMTKPGGVLVYATCSLLPAENDDQVRAFLAGPQGANWTLLKEEHHFPDQDGFDGFYGAALQRKTTNP